MADTAKHILWQNGSKTDPIMVDYANSDSDGNEIISTYEKKYLTPKDEPVGKITLSYSEEAGSEHYVYKLENSSIESDKKLYSEFQKFINNNTYYLQIVKIVSDDKSLNFVSRPIIFDDSKIGFYNQFDATQVIIEPSKNSISVITDEKTTDTLTVSFYFDTL